jgi:hypothetical protein
LKVVHGIILPVNHPPPPHKALISALVAFLNVSSVSLTNKDQFVVDQDMFFGVIIAPFFFHTLPLHTYMSHVSGSDIFVPIGGVYATQAEPFRCLMMAGLVDVSIHRSLMVGLTGAVADAVVFGCDTVDHTIFTLVYVPPTVFVVPVLFIVVLAKVTVPHLNV